MENRVKTLIADGYEESRDHVKRRLEQVPGYEIVGTAADGQRAAELMRGTKPDILVLDLMLSKLDGIAVLKRAREMDKPPAALVLTGFMTEYVANMAASLGVQYFMTYDQHGNLAYLSVANESLHPAAYAFYYTQAEGAWVLTGVGSAQEDLILF